MHAQRCARITRIICHHLPIVSRAVQGGWGSGGYPVPLSAWGGTAPTANWGTAPPTSSLWSTDDAKQKHFQRFLHGMFRSSQKFVFKPHRPGGWGYNPKLIE